MVKKVEDEVGVELFYGNGREVEMRDGGERMYSEGSEMTQ